MEKSVKFKMRKMSSSMVLLLFLVSMMVVAPSGVKVQAASNSLDMICSDGTVIPWSEIDASMDAVTAIDGTIGSGSETRFGETIFGEDDRVRVTNTRQYPYSAIVRLSTNNDDGVDFYRGTGFLIAPDTILTSAHNIYDIEAKSWYDISAIDVVPGYNNQSAPYGKASVTWCSIPGEYANDGDWRYDIAIVKLDKPLGNQAGTMGLTTQVYADTYTAGYPSDLDNNLGRFMYAARGTSTSIVDNLLIYGDIDIASGQSGSPWYDSNYRAFGVTLGEHPHTNVATMITPDFLKWISYAA